jgi:hypothetical protein
VCCGDQRQVNTILLGRLDLKLPVQDHEDQELHCNCKHKEPS